MSKFETGKTYSTRSICNHDCIIKKRLPEVIGFAGPADYLFERTSTYVRAR